MSRRRAAVLRARRHCAAANLPSSSVRLSAPSFSGRQLQSLRRFPASRVPLVAAGTRSPPAARSEGHADPYAPSPEHTAFLPDLAVKKLEALGQVDHRKYFEAGAARGVIDQPAGNRRQLRAHDDLGLACLRSRGPNALIEPRELAFCHAAMVPARQLPPP